MPFSQLQSAQQIETVVAGPGDVNRLFVCKGLAQGNFTVGGTSGLSIADTWQFEVGPQLEVTQFRRAIATASFAGLQLTEQASASAFWVIQTVFADFDDDLGKIRVSVTSSITVYGATAQPGGGPGAYAGEAALAYDVAILAAMPAGA